ncbi:MAG: amino acid ABC transporter substrate-binding protein [Desulfobacterales bacterium]|nr:amino acid ABC transporter substrate-binding protein [Desulfobacterales bacterium]
MRTPKILVLFTLLLICTPFCAIADQITIVADPWCPFTCQQDTPKQGFMIEIAENAFREAGHTVKLINLDWDKAVEETRKGTYSAVAGAYKEDAPDFVFPEQAQGKAGTVFFVTKDSKWRFKDLGSLKKVKVGVIKGYSYGEKLDAVFKEKEKAGELLVSAGESPLELLIESLLDGKIDTLIEDPAVLADFLVENALFDILGNIDEAGMEGAPEPVYVAFSPANPKSKEYAEILSKGTSELRKSGKLAVILKKYQIKDWQ